MLGILVLLAAGCCKKDGALRPVHFTLRWQDWNRSSLEALPDGTVVGIIASDALNVPNVKAVSSDAALEPEIKLFWQSRQTEPTLFLAYMPYNPSLSGLPFDFSVREDQREEEGYRASDFLSSTVSTSPGNTVPFILRHRLTRMTVIVTGVTDMTGKVRSVLLERVPRKGTLPDMAADFADVTDAGPVQAGAFVEEDGRTGYSALFFPSEQTLSFVVTTTRDRTFSYVLPSPMTFKAGEAYQTVVNLSEVPGSGGNLPFTVSVSDWADGGNIPFL